MQPLVTCDLAGKYTFQAPYCSSPRFISLSSIDTPYEVRK